MKKKVCCYQCGKVIRVCSFETCEEGYKCPVFAGQGEQKAFCEFCPECAEAEFGVK